MFGIFIFVTVLLAIANQTVQIPFQSNQTSTIKNDHLVNVTNVDIQQIVDELRKNRSLLEENGPRQVILSVVSFFVAMALAIFGIQLVFRPQKREVKYFTASILSLIIPVTILLISYVASVILGIPGLGIIAKNVWLFASLMLLIPVITLIFLLILHRKVKEQ